MKKILLSILMMLVLIAGTNSLMAQWAQYKADALPQDDATVKIDDGQSLVGGTSEIIADPEDATNNLWSYSINTDQGDELKYSWYPSYWDMTPGVENTPVPAPSTMACKFKWVDTTSVFGPRIEVREAYKVNATPVKKKGLFFLEINDWGLDSVYALPESFDLTQWHVMRLTSNGADWKLYLDEDPTEFGSGTCGKTVGKHLALFSAYGANGKSEIMIDWMGYIEDAASSPTDMPLPEGVWTPPAVSVNPVNENLALSIFPNPASELLTVSVGNDLVNSQYELMSITGKVIRRGSLNAQINTIDVSSFKSGMYFLRATSGEKVISDSFIVK